MRRALLMSAVLAVAPASHEAALIWCAALAVDFGWFFLEAIAKAQFWALAIISPVIVATKAYDRLRRFT